MACISFLLFKSRSSSVASVSAATSFFHRYLELSFQTSPLVFHARGKRWRICVTLKDVASRKMISWKVPDTSRVKSSTASISDNAASDNGLRSVIWGINWGKRSNDLPNIIQDQTWKNLLYKACLSRNVYLKCLTDWIWWTQTKLTLFINLWFPAFYRLHVFKGECLICPHACQQRPSAVVKTT